MRQRHRAIARSSLTWVWHNTTRGRLPIGEKYGFSRPAVSDRQHMVPQSTMETLPNSRLPPTFPAATCRLDIINQQKEQMGGRLVKGHPCQVLSLVPILCARYVSNPTKKKAGCIKRRFQWDQCTVSFRMGKACPGESRNTRGCKSTVRCILQIIHRALNVIFIITILDGCRFQASARRGGIGTSRAAQNLEES
jgi:hypothetical protein